MLEVLPKRSCRLRERRLSDCGVAVRASPCHADVSGCVSSTATFPPREYPEPHTARRCSPEPTGYLGRLTRFDGEILRTFAFLTTAASHDMVVHKRMPDLSIRMRREVGWKRRLGRAREGNARPAPLG